MQSRGFLVIVGILIAGTIGAIVFSNRSADTPTNTSAAEITATDHVRGKADSPVTLIEYGDLQCPACRQYDPVVEQLYFEYGDRVRFVFRHFPLSRIHPNAIAGARAVEAAGKQEAFFEMASIMYQQQPLWAESQAPAQVFEQFAAQLGLDVERFKTDMASSETLDIINAQLKTGEELGVTGTPTFVLNGSKIETPQSLEAFQQLLDQKLAESGSQSAQ